MPHFFISYSKKDTRDLALKLNDALNALPDVTAWLDKSLQAGRSWETQIQSEIERCDFMLVLYSPDINRHQQEQEESYVLTEISYAKYTVKKPIIPVMAQKTAPPIALTTTQYIDFTLDGLTLADLVDTIAKETGIDLNPKPPGPPSSGGSVEIAKETGIDLTSKSFTPPAESLSSMEVALKLIEQGRDQYQKYNYLNALKSFQQAMDFAPDSLIDDLHYEIGKIYTVQKDTDLAEKHFLNALQINSHHVHALIGLGKLYGKKANPPYERNDEPTRNILLLKAQEKYSSALNIQPDLLDDDQESVWSSLGSVYRHLNQIDKAIECYKKAIAVRRTVYPYINLGMLYMEKGEFENTRRNFALVKLFAQQKLTSNPLDSWAYNDLLIAYLVEGNLKEAKNAFSYLQMLQEIHVLESLRKTLKRFLDKFQVLKPEVREYVTTIITEIEHTSADS